MGISSCSWKRSNNIIEDKHKNGDYHTVSEFGDGLSIEPVLDNQLMAEKIKALGDRLDARGLSICLMGIDGSGKTTLSTQLSEIFNRLNVRNRRLHIYSIYQNMLTTPLLLLWNRYYARRMLIFDRTIFDNIAVFFGTRPSLHCLLPFTLRMIRLLYPGYDHYIYLQTTFDETMLRRPEVAPKRYHQLSRSYKIIIDKGGFDIFDSTQSLLENVIEVITANEKAH